MLKKPGYLFLINKSSDAGQVIYSGTVTLIDGTNTPGGSANLTVVVERPFTGTLSKAVTSVSINQQQGQLGAGAIRASHSEVPEAFIASTQYGAVHKINADHSTNQIAETKAQPLERLSSVMREVNENPLPGILGAKAGQSGAEVEAVLISHEKAPFKRR